MIDFVHALVIMLLSAVASACLTGYLMERDRRLHAEGARRHALPPAQRVDASPEPVTPDEIAEAEIEREIDAALPELRRLAIETGTYSSDDEIRVHARELMAKAGYL